MDGNANRHDVVGIVAQIHPHHAHESLNRRSRSSQQKKRQRDLSGDQHAVELFSAHAAGHFSRARLHDLADFRARTLQRRKKSEEYSRGHGQAHAEQEHGHVDVKVRLVGERVFRKAGNDESKALVGK